MSETKKRRNRFTNEPWLNGQPREKVCMECSYQLEVWAIPQLSVNCTDLRFRLLVQFCDFSADSLILTNNLLLVKPFHAEPYWPSYSIKTKTTYIHKHMG